VKANRFFFREQFLILIQKLFIPISPIFPGSPSFPDLPGKPTSPYAQKNKNIILIIFDKTIELYITY